MYLFLTTDAAAAGTPSMGTMLIPMIAMIAIF